MFPKHEMRRLLIKLVMQLNLQPERRKEKVEEDGSSLNVQNLQTLPCH